MLPGMLVAKVKLSMFPLLDDIGDVKCGRLGAFLALHEATPPDRSWVATASADFSSGPSVHWRQSIRIATRKALAPRRLIIFSL
jgi:hypothetical protein